jgi:hypothetical protein
MLVCWFVAITSQSLPDPPRNDKGQKGQGLTVLPARLPALFRRPSYKLPRNFRTLSRLPALQKFFCLLLSFYVFGIGQAQRLQALPI